VIQLLAGDALEQLARLPAGHVHCCVTSPPYYGLRDYGCTGQIGLEPTPDEYISTLVAVFREVRRVLRPDGTCWVNIGDSYAGANGNTAMVGGKSNPARGIAMGFGSLPRRGIPAGIKPKDLVGIPWMLAFALRADGWVLRQELIWNKPNPMPESVQDRCTKAHEQIFMFAKARWSGPPPGRYAHISEQDARWLALFFDTEGNLCLRREAAKENDYGAHAAQIVLANTHRPLLEAVARIVGDGSILERGGQNAPMFYWQLAGKKAADLLSVIYPHLIVKRRQARCLLYLESTKSYRGGHARLASEIIAQRDRLWSAVKQLNHFGEPDISWVPEPAFGKWADCERYWFDAAAIAEPAVSDDRPRQTWQERKDKGEPLRRGDPGLSGHITHTATLAANAGRNKRSVWTVTSEPFAEAHFATFPPALIEPCILAGCPKDGTVLDPFAGAGTTGLVADRLNRGAILIELNPTYCTMIHNRITNDAPLFVEFDNPNDRDGSWPPRCAECGRNFADPPSALCPGCDAYREHQR
jgi:DNA modification methylase